MKLFSKIAYHSTKQRGLKAFEPFTSSDKARTGEGALAHGWGLYLQADKQLNTERYLMRFDAQSQEGVFYQNMLWSYFEEHEIVISSDSSEVMDESDPAWMPIKMWTYDENCVPRDQFIQRLKFLIKEYEGDEYQLELINAVNFVESHPEMDYKYIHDDVSQYTVDIPDDFFFYFEDNDALNECRGEFSLQMKSKLEKMFTNVPELTKFLEFGFKYDCEKLLEMMKMTFKETYGNDGLKQLSIIMNKYGFDGIEYYGERDGRCYVIFNCERLNIIKEE